MASASQKKVVVPRVQIPLPPDAAILLQARIRMGEPRVRFKEIANLIMHDPVVALEFLQYANSAMYAGVAVLDLEAALLRLGSQRVLSTLVSLNDQPQPPEDEVCDMFHILRYGCRRVSIVSMIVATAVRPQMATQARLAGLFAKLGHMMALIKLGPVYCALAKSPKTKNLPYRLEKDHKLELGAMLVQCLRTKGIPEKLIAPYNIDEELKSRADVDLRMCVRSAMELVEAYDAGKLEAYHPGRILPAQSSLRLLQINSLQQGRIHSACREYLTRVALHEAPEGANMVLTELDEEETMEVATEESGVDPIRVPVYKSAEITPKSLDQLQDFMRLCEEEKDKGKLKRRAVEYLKKSGLFERAALVRINVLNDLALVEHAIGLGKRGGDKVEISNPLSPFHTFKTDIRSCNIKSGAFMAPFGVSAYAIGPVELESGERVVLYADQGREGVLSMESRRVFRLALGMLMQSVQAL